MIREINQAIEAQNKGVHDTYCYKCGRGNPLVKWEYHDYEIDRYHGFSEIKILRKCPNCNSIMSFLAK